MKFLHYLALAMLLVLSSCKKDAVDGASVRTFQSSINDMTSELNTLQQTKFNEALYVLKTFAVEGKTDMEKLEALAKLLNTKKVPEIFALADEVAQKNNVDWFSTAPPSLGEMNIFQNITATEADHNDIKASSLDIVVKPIEVDSVAGAKALRIIPKLKDNSGNDVQFSGAGLEAVMEVYSNGDKLLTAKNLITDNHFKGFYLKMSSIPAESVVEGKIDIKMSVKTTKKIHQFLKTGIPVNEQALRQAVEVIEETDTETPQEEITEKPMVEKPVASTEKPEKVVGRFLSHLASQNLKAAYEASENPSWGSYDKFSNPNSGFGGVKSISVKNISAKGNNDKNASVNATYQMIDKDGNVLIINASYQLKQTDNGWKIINYKINSTEKP